MSKRGGKFLSDSLDSHWRKYRKRLKTCRCDVSEDNVHELRISTRRLLALIELLRTLRPHPNLSKLRKALKLQLDGFDELRDTQVMLLEIEAAVPSLPDLAPFLVYLQQREQELLLAVGPRIAEQKPAKLRRKVAKAGRRFQSHTAKTDLEAAIFEAVDQVYATTLERYRAIDAGDLASIHHLRIPLKKLRYLLGALGTFTPDMPENHLNRMQIYLTRMGDIQNSSVLIKALAVFFADGIPEETLNYYQGQQRALIDSFMDHREEIYGFWRNAAEAALPWQSEDGNLN